MPGKLYVNGEVVECKPVDISEHGLGVLIPRQIHDDADVLLDLKRQKISLKIIWAKPDFGKHDLWRYGLVSKTPGVNLHDIFEIHGCMKGEQTT